MRTGVLIGVLLVSVADQGFGAGQTAPPKAPAVERPAAAPPAAEPVVAPVAPAPSPSEPDPSERQLLMEILRELRGMRGDIRSLQRSMQVPRPPAPTPPPPPSSVKLGVGPMLGRADAEVAIVEFSEFQCPFCKRYHEQAFGELKKSYVDSGKVRYEFRDFPLGMHQQARPAAIAARCAGEQGAFWQMREEIFKGQATLGPELFAQASKTLQLDGGKFQKCLADPKWEKVLSEQVAAADALGVQGTPHFLLGLVKGGEMVGVRVLNGAQPFESFRAAIDALLVAPPSPPEPPAPPARQLAPRPVE